jgi:putative transposase
MKYRDYKQLTQGQYYHIYNRGNGKMDIFLDKQDFKFFLFRLKENLHPELLEQGTMQGRPLQMHRRTRLPIGTFDLVCYILMPNHFHFLFKQNTALPISKIISKVCTSYSIYFNKKYKTVGHVFQDRFKAIQIEDDNYLLWLSAYIHGNPKAAGLVNNLEKYQWSSYPEYLGQQEEELCQKGIILEQFKKIDDYKKFVEEAQAIIERRKDLENFLID